MSSPATRDAGGSRDATAVGISVVLALLGVVLLEAWRPHYFLTDDNLAVQFPVLSEIGRRLLQGRSPFVSDCLFGGAYSLLRDPCCLCMWHPGILALSLLANTAARFWIVDLIAGSQLVLATASFVLLLNFLRRGFNPSLGNGAVVFLGLSYGFSGFNVLVGTSWYFYLANQVALPLYLLGLLHPSRARGVLLAALGCAHACLSGFPSTWVFALLYASAMAAGLGACRRSAEPILRWGAALGAALLALSPILGPALLGFWGSPRSAAFTLQDASFLSMAHDHALLSVFLGALGKWTPIVFHDPVIFSMEEDHVRALGFFVASWFLFPAVAARRRWRAIEVLMVALWALVLLVMARPAWLGRLFLAIPFLGAIRWPFREMYVAVFFLHVLLALRLPALPRARALALGAVGVAILGLSLVPAGPPSFNPMGRDRHLLFSGKADAFWKDLAARVDLSGGYLPVAPAELVFLKNGQRFPHGLVGSYDYASLRAVRNLTGALAAPPRTVTEAAPIPYHWAGIYAPSDLEALRRWAPRAAIVQVHQLQPLVITVETNRHAVALAPPQLWHVAPR